MEKMTNKKALSYVLSTYAESLPVDVAEKLENMVIQLDKRASTERKPSARQMENELFKAQILEAMEQDRLYSVAEMVKEFTFFPSDMTPQRCSALMTQLVEMGKVERLVEKRKVFFKVIGE